MNEKDKDQTPLSLGIEIDPDGRVVFTDLPEDLIDVVRALDPDAIIGCDLPTTTPTDEKEDPENPPDKDENST